MQATAGTHESRGHPRDNAATGKLIELSGPDGRLPDEPAGKFCQAGDVTVTLVGEARRRAA